MSQSVLWGEFAKAIRHELKPALGCTEPISLALACAVAAHHLGGIPERIEAKVSPNLMKNGMGVTVPGTGMVGLPIAAAVGALGGDPDAGLEVLRKITPQIAAAGKAMLAEDRVAVGIAEVPHVLYSEACLMRAGESVRVCIVGSHTHVARIEKNGSLLFLSDEIADVPVARYSLDGATASLVFDYAASASLDELGAIVLESARLNAALADAGQGGDYGLHVAATMQRNVMRGLLSNDLQTRIVMRSVAASDARMGGAVLPAMSNSGSGNQGITATLPVVVVAQHVGASTEKLARALLLSHLMAIYIHYRLPKLSALCAVTTAAMGAAAGMAWLLGGDYRTVSMAICSMIGDLAGMICDGASNSCAMKVSTSVSSAYKAVLMALDNSRVTGQEGIVADDVDDSIVNLCALASGGMAQTDRQIIEIILNKC